MIKRLLLIVLLYSYGILSAQEISYNRTETLRYFQNMDFESCLEWLKTKQLDAYNKSYLMDMGYCYYMMEMPLEARDTYLKIAAQEPLDFQANLFLATIYDNQIYNKDDSAAFYYKMLTTIQPQQSKFWYLGGRSLNSVREYDAAFAYFEKAFELNPSSGKITVAYAKALERRKEGDRAAKVIDAFLAKDNANVDVIQKKISMSHKLKAFKDVIYWGELLLKDSLPPASSFYSYMYLAYSYLNTNQIDKSIALCDCLIEHNLGAEQITYCLALCYGKKGDYTRSNHLLDECIELNLLDQAQTYFRAKADNYTLMKQYAKAASEIDTSFYIFQDPIDLYLAGKIYDDLKNKPKAALYYKKFLSQKKNPASPLEAKLENYIKEYLKAD
ncbi:tetratricopeptide repeat protein [Niabella insulamsoli]|uniref:tetratricopeptide repeat protein n=1 Tax=Niabella insulamsoli TaxID=3144874 RepID=UPI0031FD7756